MWRQGKLPGRSRPLHDARAVDSAEPAHERVPGGGDAAATGGRAVRQGLSNRRQAAGAPRDLDHAGGQTHPGQRPQLGVRVGQQGFCEILKTCPSRPSRPCRFASQQPPQKPLVPSEPAMDMTPHFPIYLDYGATTPVDPRVVDAMVPWLREHFGNPASRSHAWGWEAEEAVERARAQVADLIGADPREIVWTSGATESINLALKGAAQFYQGKGRHLITLKTEHKAVLDTTRELERQGFEVTYLDVQEDGLLDLDKLKAAMRPDTILVSVMFVNNEIGVIQDIPTIGAMCREKGIIFHVDGAQATGKVAIDLKTLPVDLLSLASHKTYGPKGIGALYVRRKPRVRLEAQMHGGGHERGMRSGTLPTHQI